MHEIISTALRDFLIEHIDYPVPIRIREDGAGRRHLRARAIASGLVHPYPWGVARPHETRITDKGRERLASALADWADALSRAQDNRDWQRIRTAAPKVQDRLPEASDSSLEKRTEIPA